MLVLGVGLGMALGLGFGLGLVPDLIQRTPRINKKRLKKAVYL